MKLRQADYVVSPLNFATTSTLIISHVSRGNSREFAPRFFEGPVRYMYQQRYYAVDTYTM